MLERDVSTCNVSEADWRWNRNLRWLPKYYISIREERNQKAATRHYVTLSSGLASDCQKFTNLRWSCTRLAKVEKRGKTEMIRCLEVALNQSHENERRRRKAEEVSPQIRTSALEYVKTQLSLTPSILTQLCISGNKRKRK